MARGRKSDLTPMMRQYTAMKRQYPGTILMFRLGDFYEMFNEDAVEAARILNLTLTRRAASKGDDMPMCGVPYHAAEGYIGKLLTHHKRVAICEQVEDPKKAKGIVKREVVRVVTPGTTFEEGQLTDDAHNYLVAVYPRAQASTGRTGCAVLDVTTGLFELAELPDDEALGQELERLQPRELLVPAHFPLEQWDTRAPVRDALVVPIDDLYYDDGRNVLLEHFNVLTLDGFGCERMPLAVAAAGAALRYVRENLHATALTHLRSLRVFHREQHMILDDVSRRNLELTRALRDGSTNGTLIGVLDETATPMGARLLRQWMTAPLLNLDRIRARQDAIEALTLAQPVLPALRAALGAVCDIERLTSRLATGYGSPRDLAGLRESLHQVPNLHALVQRVIEADAGQTLSLDREDRREELLARIAAELKEPPPLAEELDRALVDAPPLRLQDGGIIRAGYNTELDEVRVLAHNGKDWIAGLQVSEAERTGIKSLKVGYNKVFGYYIEVTKPNLHLVPEEYIRKQTIANGERFLTPELKEMESRILNAEERARELEADLFQQLRLKVAAENERLQHIAQAVAALDVLNALATIALQRNYSRPEVRDDDMLEIEAGRHPVVERLLPAQQFVPNDVHLNTRDAQIVVLTGPNMSGKSTYIRQVALLTLMAQMGSFIPAASARIGLVDRIFTRVGASDELTRGQSTFMVEMAETANILNNATSRSLVILDEIGRGTSTYDGLSIAWSVIEYLHNCAQVKARALFATHYHELVQLEHQLAGVVNYNVAVREYADNVVFLHEIVPGGSDRSYGIHVARLAGLPERVIARATTILEHLEATHQETAEDYPVEPPQAPEARNGQGEEDGDADGQMSLF